MTELTHYIRTYDDAIPAAFCRQVIDRFESEPELQQRNGGSVRAGLEKSSWLERDFSDNAEIGNLFRNSLRHFKSAYERDCGIRPALPAPGSLAELIFKRYDPGGQDGFQPHFDSLGPVASRYLVFLWYLNDVADGGATKFVDLDVAVQPRAGRLLIFPPYWMYRHAGLAPISEPKYILSTYCLW